ncbi:MAG: hypothetical protein A2X89_03445 [Deltaproteobacteria bacterium GWD2_55_8]|nr:MAG: hypothetical protein A2X89_03445 [Deltaproteobacteria bacterium GWD2_55_8]
MDSQVQHDPEGLNGSGKVVSPQEGRFIYCFTERGEEAYPFTGLEGAKLETISYGDIAAVISPLRTTSLNQLEKEAVWESILKHQEVNGHISSSKTVVPVRFGTIADDSFEVKELLQKIYLQVKAALKRLEGKIELVVRTSWDLHAVIQEVKGEITIENAGATDLQEKITIGRGIFEAVEKRKRSIIDTIHHGLYPLAVDFSVGSMRESEEMIFDCSYLVRRGKETSFDEAVNRIANEYERTITFKCIGPLPPYSFARLEIAQGNFEVVDEARKALGLAERSSLEEIKASYRRLSLMHHPDRNPADPGAEERFRNVAQAYEILEAYCENNRWLEKGRIYPFAREDVESAVMVRDGGVK